MNAKFKCSQAEFYAVAGTAWKSFENNNAAFQALKSKYTAVFLADRRAELKIAEELPDEQARYANEEVLLVTLGEHGKVAKQKWQLLKRYIIDAFPKSQQKARQEEAGLLLYGESGDDNWEVMKQLFIAGKNFITTHLAVLTANNNMPALFETEYTDAKTLYDDNFQNYLSEIELAVIASQTKVSLSNDAYDDVINMMDDGKEIFKNDEAVKKQFVFDEVLALIKIQQSDSAGYETEDYDIAANSSMIVAQTAPAQTDEVYLKIIEGSNAVLVCTTDETTPACVDGYTLETGPAFKGLFSELNLNPALPKLRITNPGPGKVIVRGGKKK
jgi:hypothetical protein